MIETELKTSPRDVRVTAGGLLVGPPLERGRAVSRFARSIARRYEEFHLRPPSVAFVFRQTRPGVMSIQRYQPIQVHLSTHFALTVSPAPTPRGSASLTFARQIETQVLRQQIVHTVQEHWQIESFVHRLAAREIRLDSAAAAEAATVHIKPASHVLPGVAFPTSPAPSWATTRPVPRVLRRAAPPSPDESTASPPANSTPASRDETRLKNSWPSSPQSPAPVDINHLTEQVVQAIDRRMIAHRERRGRV